MTDDVFWLTDQQFDRLRPLLPSKPRGVPRADDRRVISGIVHVLMSGCGWTHAPEVYGPRMTLYNRYVRWASAGVWTRVFEALEAAGGPPRETLPDRPGDTQSQSRRIGISGKSAGGIG